jgi:membrane protease YdiL (CAAX protease family)
MEVCFILIGTLILIREKNFHFELLSVLIVLINWLLIISQSAVSKIKVLVSYPEISYIFGSIFLIGNSLFLLKKFKLLKHEKFNLKLKDFGLSVIYGLCIFFIGTVYSIIIQYFSLVHSIPEHDILKSGNLHIILPILVILVPLAEEFFFRGFLVRYLQFKISFLNSLIFAAFLFSIVHPFIYFFPVFFSGIIFGLISRQDRGLVKAVIAHGTNNLITMLVMIY